MFSVPLSVVTVPKFQYSVPIPVKYIAEYISGTMSKPNFYFDGLPGIPLKFCVYDMTLVLLKLNGKMIVKWLSEQFWRCYLCIIWMK